MKALITGITGQDGSYLAEKLLDAGFEVHGIIRRSSSFSTSRIDHLFRDPHENTQLKLHYGDITDSMSLISVLEEARPDWIFHLAAQSHVKVSFENPEYTAQATALGTLKLLDATRRLCPDARFYYAATSEMYGNIRAPQDEMTPMVPVSPYGAAKLYGFNLCRNYREAYGMPVSCGILFNHESPRRGETFVTKKITRAVARIKAGQQDFLYLGNLAAKRDWGYAPEYVDAMIRMMEVPPDDFVIATGKTHSVLEFVHLAFAYAGLDASKYIVVDPRYQRPNELHVLQGDATKAKRLLGWTPQTSFGDLVRLMLDHDLQEVRRAMAA